MDILSVQNLSNPILLQQLVLLRISIPKNIVLVNCIRWMAFSPWKIIEIIKIVVASTKWVLHPIQRYVHFVIDCILFRNGVVDRSLLFLIDLFGSIFKKLLIDLIVCLFLLGSYFGSNTSSTPRRKHSPLCHFNQIYIINNSILNPYLYLYRQPNILFIFSMNSDMSQNNKIQTNEQQTKPSQEDVKIIQTSDDKLEVEKQEKQEKGDENKKDKKVQITMKELSAMNKKLKKLQKFKKENEELRKYIQAVQKRLQETKKTQMQKQGLEQTIKELQKIINQSTKNQQKAKRQEEKFKEISKHEKEMNTSLKAEVEELRSISSEYFSLKQQVSRLNTEYRHLKEAKQQYPQMVKKYEGLQSVIQELKGEINKKNQECESQKAIKQKLQKRVQTLMNEKNEINKEKDLIVCEKQEILGELDAIKEQIQLQRAETEVFKKKYNNEIKQLKIALHQQIQKLKITQNQLLESRKKEKKLPKLQERKMSSLSKQELFNLIEESEMKNVTLKMAINDVSDKMQSLQKKIAERDKAIMTLSRQIVKAHPTLQESEGMDYVEKDIIQIGLQQKSDWPEIVEKVMLQNLRLKHSVTALGQQYNEKMRKIQKF